VLVRIEQGVCETHLDLRDTHAHCRHADGDFRTQRYRAGTPQRVAHGTSSFLIARMQRLEYVHAGSTSELAVSDGTRRSSVSARNGAFLAVCDTHRIRLPIELVSVPTARSSLPNAGACARRFVLCASGMMHKAFWLDIL